MQKSGDNGYQNLLVACPKCKSYKLKGITFSSWIKNAITKFIAAINGSMIMSNIKPSYYTCKKCSYKFKRSDLKK